MTIRFASCLLALIAIAAPAARAQALTAEEILDRHVKATYGDKHADLKSYRATGKFELRAQGISAPITILAKAPNKLCVQIEIPGMGSIEEGYDGKTAWANDPSTGPREKDGAEATAARYAADFYGDAQWRTRYKTVSLKGEETVGERKTYRLELAVEGLTPISQWIDAETFLAVQTQMEVDIPQGKFVVTTKFSDYRPISETSTTKMAFKTQQVMAGMTQDITVEKVETNVEIDEARFAPRK